eukprot:6352539-Amphidinium_carterae.5
MKCHAEQTGGSRELQTLSEGFAFLRSGKGVHGKKWALTKGILACLGFSIECEQQTTTPTQTSGIFDVKKRELLQKLQATPQVSAPLPCRAEGFVLRGIEISPAGHCRLLLRKETDGGIPAPLFADLVRSVFSLPLNKPLFFSLDPPSRSAMSELGAFGPMRFCPLHQQRLPAELRGSALAQLMHHCDYILKEMSVGIELNAVSLQQRQFAPGLRALLPDHLAQMLEPRSDGNSHQNRLWLEAADVHYSEREHNGVTTYALDSPTVVVRCQSTEYDPTGTLRDTATATDLSNPGAQFASIVTAIYPLLVKYLPEFGWLSEVPKMRFMQRVLHEHMDKWCEQYCAERLGSVSSYIERQGVQEWPTPPPRHRGSALLKAAGLHKRVTYWPPF